MTPFASPRDEDVFLADVGKILDRLSDACSAMESRIQEVEDQGRNITRSRYTMSPVRRNSGTGS